MMDGILDEFRRTFANVTLSAPTRPFISNVTGRWIDAADAINPDYWVNHLRHAVRFNDGLTTLMAGSESALMEVGPGKTLLSFAKRILSKDHTSPLVASLRQRQEQTNDLTMLMQSIARLWVNGVEVEWSGLHDHERRLRVSLPTYPFERSRFWLKPDPRKAPEVMPVDDGKRADVADWFYVPGWTASSIPTGSPKGDGRPWLILGDGAFADVIEQQLIGSGETVRRVSFGKHFNPSRAEDMAGLFEPWRDGFDLPGYIIHAGNVRYGASLVNQQETQDRAFFSTLALIQELGRAKLSRPVRVGVVTDRLFAIGGDSSTAPERATLLGPCRVTPREHADIRTSAIDLPEITTATETQWADQLIAEMTGAHTETIVAYRNNQRFVQALEKTRLTVPDRSSLPLKQGGCYLITGGTGGIGLTVAEHLARHYQAKLILTSRSGAPAANDPRAKRIREIEALGADVWVAKADVSDAAAMTRAVEDAEKQFGRVDGVFHTAGVPGGGAIQRKKREVAARVLEPKVKGTLVLDALFKDRNPDFVMLFSSAAAVAGPFGQVDYCAANSFLDAFATARHGRSSTLWLSIDWDDWAEVGMAVETSARLGVDDAPAADHVEALTHPLFARKEQHGASTVLVAPISTESGWLLGEHVLFGLPTVPGSAYLEFARAAYECVTGREACEMKDLFVLMPMAVPAGTERDLRVVLTPSTRGYDFVIESGAAGDRQEHVRGAIGALVSPEIHRDIAALRSSCTAQKIDSEILTQFRATRESGYLVLGRRWNNTQQVFYGADTMLGEHALDAEFVSDVATYKLHPAFTDFTALFPLYFGQTPAQYVPFSYDAVRVWGPLPSRVLSWTKVKDRIDNSPRAIRFDCHFLDESGRELLEIDNLVLHLMEGHARAEMADPSAPNFTLGLQTPGVLDSFAAMPSERREPQAGEVEIQVAAAGLNFRDVLRALGMLSGEHDAGAAVVGFGAECSGKVVRIGPGVTNVAVGDDVLAFSTKSFSGFVTTSAKAVARIPMGIGFAEAASIPMVFLTAYHALNGLARVRKGERVLIHAAAGGVGLAAVQIAQMKGAEVFASVGSTAKREYLESLGVKHITTSRSLEFADDIRRMTNGEGVDVVLNALAGDFITASLGVLRSGGRFVEIGARDIYQNTPIGLRPFANNLSFSAFDLGQVAVATPDYLNEMLVEILQAFELGRLHLLPMETYPITEAAAAFQYMAGARHIGKIVVSVAAMVRSASTAAQTSTSTTGSGRDLSHGILPAEGVDALERALAFARPHVIVTTRQLSTFTQTSSGSNAASAPAPKARKMHPRPALLTPYKAPETPEEQSVELVWRDLLGIEKIGVNDSFFELGGDSLLGVQLISVMKAKHAEYADNIRPADLYEGPTIKELARKLVMGAEPAATTTAPTSTEGRRERRRPRKDSTDV
jgi:hypothetical protein